MLEYHRSSEAKKSGSLSISWENTSKPVMSGNSEKFRRFLTAAEILLIEAVAHEEMSALDYSLTHPRQDLIALHDSMMREKLKFRWTEYSLKWKAEINHLFKDKNSVARMRKNLYMTSIRALRRITTPHA
jgi:hypothetical protein